MPVPGISVRAELYLNITSSLRPSEAAQGTSGVFGDLFLAVFGLPLHPLAVHFAVVLFPISLLAFLGVLFVPKLRIRFTIWAAGLVALTTPTVVLAQQSGIALSNVLYIPNPHAILGTILTPLALVTGAVAIATGLSILRKWPKPWQRVLGFTAVVLAIASIVMTVIVGHSGSAASWGGVLP